MSIKTSITFDKEVYQELKKISQSLKLPLSSLVNIACKKLIKEIKERKTIDFKDL